jgi:CHAT domain-containing protein
MTCRTPFAVCALALVFGACKDKPAPSPAALYSHARTLLQLEKLDAASAETARGLALVQSDSAMGWQFRILRAEILLAQREARQAASILASPPPPTLTSPELRARYYLCQSHLCHLLHDEKGAQTHLDEAEKAAANLSGGSLPGEIRLRRAALAIAADDSDAARQELDRVMAYADANHDDFLRLGATGTMGYMLLQDGQCDSAVPWFQRAAALAKALGTQISEGRSVGNLGYCLFELGDFAKALSYLRLAEARSAAAGSRYERQIWLGNIGNIEEVNGDYSSAVADYSKALAIARQLDEEYWTAVWLDDLAAASIEQKQWDAAERYNNEASAHRERAGDRKSAAYAVVNAGQIANGRARHGEAISLFQKVVLQPPKDVILTLEAHTGLAEAFAATHREHEALLEFRAAVSQTERRQSALPDEEHKLSWFASVIRTYQRYVDFLMRRGRTIDALTVALSSRGRVLNTRMDEGKPRPQTSVGELQFAAARTGGTLLVYFVGSRQSYAWVIDRTGIRSFPVPREAELRKLVASYSAFVQQLHDPLREQCSAGRTLYDLLVAPAKISGKEVLLAPDGPLYSLNFASLPVLSNGVPHYWLEDAEISVVPAFDLVPAASRNTEPSLLLIGDPLPSDPDFSELTYARQEMTGIRAHLAGVRQVMYAREQARPAAYFESNPNHFSWIHFVAHASANQEEPLLSAVILSRAPGADYRLFAKDVLKSPIHADLVTISGCRGAGARVYEGEGLVGFSWAFLRAGARNVIAGLWDVNDRSTAELMTALYAELANGAAPAQALHAAQLQMARSARVYRKPYYWAPFETFRLISRS